MFEDRSYTRRFYSAPQSVTSFIAAFLEPVITVLVLLIATTAFDVDVGRADLVLCLLVFALTFPGRNRFKDAGIAAATDIFSSWITLLAILALCGYATKSFGYFEERVLIAWAVITPVVQWLAVVAGRNVLRRHAAQPEARRKAVVVGAGPLGVKVARALMENRDQGSDFVGYFDDRADERVDGGAAGQLLGRLAALAPYVHEHGIKEVYITLPLGSQPRILQLLESVQGTTASIFFVPDVFGISIIQ
ncbi:MAG: undecaprenyl-phosphate glucose phosphotransferase, partial [Aquincola tertiaricarbonis]